MTGVHLRMQQAVGRIHPAVATQHDEARRAQCDAGGDDPSDRADHHRGVAHRRQQLPHVQLAMRQRQVMRRHHAIGQNLAIDLNVADDRGREAALLQVARDVRHIFWQRIPRLVVPFHPAHDRTDKSERRRAWIEGGGPQVWQVPYRPADHRHGHLSRHCGEDVAARKLDRAVAQGHALNTRRRRCPERALLALHVAPLQPQSFVAEHELHRQVGVQLGPRRFEIDLALEAGVADQRTNVY